MMLSMAQHYASFARPSQSRVQRKKKQKIRFIARFLLILSIIGVAAYLRPLPNITISATPPATCVISQNHVRWPADASAAIGAVGYGVLAANHPSEQPRPTASLAKVITALTVLQAKPLQNGSEGPKITMTQRDVDSYNSYLDKGGTVVKVAAREQISEYQALEGMLLPSGNNMADTLALWAFGSIQNYSQQANSLVKKLHMDHTTVGTDASGLSPTTVSTPEDLVLLGEAAMQDPTIASIASRTSANITTANTIYNANYLVGEDGVVGLKNGYSDQALATIIFAAKYDVSPGQTVTVVGSMMGAPSMYRIYNEAIPMLDSMESGFHIASAIHSGQTINNIQIPWSKKPGHIIASQNIPAPFWHNQAPQTVIETNTFKSKDKAFEVSMRFGTITTTVPLAVDQPIPKASTWWRITRW